MELSEPDRAAAGSLLDENPADGRVGEQAAAQEAGTLGGRAQNAVPSRQWHRIIGAEHAPGAWQSGRMRWS